MKKLLLLAFVTMLTISCKKENNEFVKEIVTPGDGYVNDIPYSEINAEKIFKGKKINTNYKVMVYFFENGKWVNADVNNFAGGKIILTINQTTGDLRINFSFAPFGTDQRFRIVISK